MAEVLGMPKELTRRILFTLGMLAIYRVGVHIPVPGVNIVALQQFMENLRGTAFGLFNVFTGGAFEKFSILALGVMPYISSSIIMQLLTVSWPYLAELKKEGEAGNKKITQFTRYGTVLLCIVQGYAISTWLSSGSGGVQVVMNPGLGFTIMTIVTLTTGTIFLMWLGEQMTEKGIGNGISLLIFAGIVSGLPGSMATVFKLWRTGEMPIFKVALLFFVVLVVFYIIIFVERGNRRVPVQYAKRVVGRKVYGGQNTHIPLKVNTAGVIPPIFASSLIMFPSTIAQFFPNQYVKNFATWFQPGALIYNLLFVGGIMFFCFFYTAIVFKTDDVADNLKKYGGFIPGIRPGTATAEYIDYVLTRITTGGALYISLVCVLPTFLIDRLNVPPNVAGLFGGTSVLIMVGVALDTVAQIQTHMISKNYDSFKKHTRVKGRREAYS